MANGAELKGLSIKRKSAAKILIEAKDYENAAYMMGICLELALKAAACKTLRLEIYPESSDSEDSYFKSHKFDRLLRISGLSDLFSVRTIMVNQDAFDNWSTFTQAFIFADKEWVAMRYDAKMLATFNKKKVLQLYNALYEDKNSILKVIMKGRRW